jgi:hypothetical protein
MKDPLRIVGRRAVTAREIFFPMPEDCPVFVCDASGWPVEIAVAEAYEAAFTRLVPAG